MIRIIDSAEAQRTILNRAAFGSTTVPMAVQTSLRRIFGEALTPDEAVRRILADVRQRGDTALREWTERIDGTALDDLTVGQGEIAAAISRLAPSLYAALEQAAERIRLFHEQQPLPDWTTGHLGGQLGQRVTPLRRVGIYVPGGSAPLPSSLLMAAIPARVAGVPELIIATPPGASREVPDIILAAAHLAGISAIYRLGGAQAIAALAFGTDGIPPADKIVGPGNLFVTLAKQQLFGLVGIDGLYGPTETVIVADETANPAWLAADLLAQAEHDILATAILLTPSRPLAEVVQAQVGQQVEALSRAAIIAQALAGQGGIVLTRDLAEAVCLANRFAPEHLCLSVARPEVYLPAIDSAGGVFLGERSFEVLGDYVAGPSHTMPTGGTARFASALNVLDFVRITSIIGLDEATGARLTPVAAQLAEAEGLTAHANAARLRARTQQGVNADEGATELLASGAMPPARAGRLNHAALVRPEIAGMEPYTPILPFEVLSERLGRPAEAIVKLDANENPYGSSPRARAALAQVAYPHIYPDPAATRLRAELADYIGLPAERLLVGAGADELIDLLARVVLSPGDGVINCPPSFGMYPLTTAVNGGQLISIPRGADFSLDVEAIERAVAENPSAKLVFLCSPNNPDGSVVGEETLQRLLALPLLVVLDEAYVEFAAAAGHRSRMDWTRKYDNLVVLRTFSKLAGLAGLRVGYGAFPEWLLPHLWKIKQPYNVNVAASAAALASLEDVDWLNEKVSRIVGERERMVACLAVFPFLRPYPSQANFVLFQVLDRDAAQLKHDLEAEGVLVRHFAKPGLEQCIRISAGRPEDTDRLVAALGRLER